MEERRKREKLGISLKLGKKGIKKENLDRKWTGQFLKVKS